ncbi:hypothetical protein STENM36S_02053 [Streptomyces tendae]
MSLNTARLDAEAADTLLAREGRRLGLPVADPMRGGAAFDRLLDGILHTGTALEVA